MRFADIQHPRTVDRKIGEVDTSRLSSIFILCPPVNSANSSRISTLFTCVDTVPNGVTNSSRAILDGAV